MPHEISGVCCSCSCRTYLLSHSNQTYFETNGRCPRPQGQMFAKGMLQPQNRNAAKSRDSLQLRWRFLPLPAKQRANVKASRCAISVRSFLNQGLVHTRVKAQKIKAAFARIFSFFLHQTPVETLSDSRCVISLRSKLASEWRVSVRLNRTELIPTAEFLVLPESTVKNR